ncbi:kinase-like protein [Rhizophagus irregularis]|uniref:Kinase-like protein n=1 Tax=Rhizophagus irregularis TaxID=588596 RepID=A0A2N0PEB8_9GLOM|nr:kinase-like protein [Rhizophagus irregularis]
MDQKKEDFAENLENSALMYLQGMVAGIDDNDCFADSSKKFFSTIIKVNAMYKTIKGKFKGQTKISDVFQVHPLEFSDYERDDNEKPRKNGRVTKWYEKTNKGAEFAFKTISGGEDEVTVQKQVAILKELHDWQNIIKFHGMISDGNQWYLVTEWAERGNLREFYQNKNDFDLKSKLRISLDIARGLNFLRTVEIFHRDIRAENILITLNETAKLANFKLIRSQPGGQAICFPNLNLDQTRYCAPELLEGVLNYKHEQRCGEVYSFGILLWEIAEERIPHQGINGIRDIIDKVCNKKYREPFSENSQMPEEFKQLEIEGM